MSVYKSEIDLSQMGMQNMMDYWFSKRSIDIHTQLPAVVTKVDYIKNSVTVLPLITTFVNSEKALPFKECEGVPVKLLSNGVTGGAKMTIPCVVGSVGLLQFSERDVSNWLQSVGNEVVDPNIKDVLSMGVTLYPVSFEMGLFTPSSAIEWDSENIVIQHGTNVIKLPKTGNITINGAAITPSGNVITKNGTDLDAFKLEFDLHVHGGIQTGSGFSALPTPQTP
jgi:hypothetical protein